MDVEKVNKYINKKVLLILKNGFKFTCVIPEFEGNSFEIIDKYEKKAEIVCSMIEMIYEQEVENE